MTLGEMILKLRKERGMSQEQLAEKIQVTRQTVSNWETNNTMPDIEQAKMLSKLFKISLDEFVGNDIQNVVEKKVSNVEKLAGMIMTILKGVGIAIIVIVLLEVIALVMFLGIRKETKEEHVVKGEVSCSLKGTDYLIELGSDGFYNCSNCNDAITKDIKAFLDNSDIDASISKIHDYFKKQQGICN